MFETEYTITPSKTVTRVTYFIVFMFLILMIVIPPLTYLDEGDLFAALIIEVIFIAIIISTLYGAWVFSPQKYTLSDTELKIIRPVRSIVIPLKKITKVEEKDLPVFKTIRTSGNGGLFSLTGRYWNKADGTFWMYAKNDNYIMIHWDEKSVISPDDKDIFIRDIKSKLEKVKRR